MKKARVEKYQENRNKYVEAILSSTSRKKLIVAGPGTGKTHLFKEIFRKINETSPPEGLAITFIRNLVANLKKDLADLAQVYTFHAFCKSKLHSLRKELKDYYPDLLRIVAEDQRILGVEKADYRTIEGYFCERKNDELIKQVLELADYYHAAGHSDAVFRVCRHYEDNPDRVPSFPLVVVDEYQDFNLLETKLIELLSYKSPILIVGDDDQALYEFKHASTKFIRGLAQDAEFERFELPFCSRCTKVIVDAVNQIVLLAKNSGYLRSRVEKKFWYFPPDKEGDSREWPYILNVRCSVERNDCHYMGLFIAKEISEIPASYIQESRERREPTVLVIGPGQFLRGISPVLFEKLGVPYDDKTKKGGGINKLDGYRFLASNRASRLGWRIIMHCEPFKDSEKIIRNAISNRSELERAISSRGYRLRHLRIAESVSKTINNSRLEKVERALLEESVGSSFEDIERYLKKESNEDSDKQHVNSGSDGSATVQCTSFERSKGLAAQVVFIVGVNENHVPQKTPPRDLDICRLIVALTRTRKKCYLVSCGYFGKDRLRPSIYQQWLCGLLSKEQYIDKNYIKRFCV